MRLLDYLDKGASLGAAEPCLTMAGHTLDYGAAQELSYRVGRALDRSGVRPGDKVAILSANDPVAFACVFGISRGPGDGGAVHLVKLCQRRVRELEPQGDEGDDDAVGERQVLVRPGAGGRASARDPGVRGAWPLRRPSRHPRARR